MTSLKGTGTGTRTGPALVLVPDPDELESPTWTARRLAKLAAVLIVLAMIGMGQLMYLFAAHRPGPAPRQGRAPVQRTLKERVDSVLSLELGGSDRGARRFTVVDIRPDPWQPGLKDIVVRWAINADLAYGSIGNGARADAFNVAHGIFTGQLPVALLRLDGTYPMHNGPASESVVMKLSMDRHTAITIGTAGWKALGPSAVWPLFTREMVVSDLQPTQSK
ncbi:MAG: hypothetical protein ACR2JC_07260 [Chloroflexota bacterium]